MCNDEYPLDERRRDDAARDRCARCGHRVPAFQRRRRAGARSGADRRRQAVHGVYAVQAALAGDRRRRVCCSRSERAATADEDRRATVIRCRSVWAARPRIGSRICGPAAKREAMRRLDAFVSRGLARYHGDRDRPDRRRHESAVAVPRGRRDFRAPVHRRRAGAQRRPTRRAATSARPRGSAN